MLTIKSKTLKYIYDEEERKYKKKGNVDGMIAVDLLGCLDELDVIVIVSGDSDYVDLIPPLLKKGKKILFMGFENNMAWELRQCQHVYFDTIRELMDSKVKDASVSKTEVPLLNIRYALQIYKAFGPLLHKDFDKEKAPEQTEVLLDKDFVWAKVVAIEAVGQEHVYDLEIEGTHNFVGNNLFAHNTYISGNVGIGTTTPGAKLEIQGSGTGGLSLNVTNDF